MDVVPAAAHPRLAGAPARRRAPHARAPRPPGVGEPPPHGASLPLGRPGLLRSARGTAAPVSPRSGPTSPDGAPLPAPGRPAHHGATVCDHPITHHEEQA